MASTPAFGEAALKGLKEMAARLLNADGSKQAPIFFPAPQMLDPVEEVVVKEQPGANAVYDTSSTLKAVKIKLKWGGVQLSLMAKLLGATFIATGTSPNRQHRLKRRATDDAPEFELEGLVDYIGSRFVSGDYHFIGYRCKMVQAPKISNQFEDYADLEAEVTCLPRADGELYDMILNETAVPIAGADNVANTVSSVPADAAAAYAGLTVVLTYSKTIQFEPSKFKLFQGTTVLTPISSTATIDATGKIVTITPASAFAASTGYAWAADNVLDLANNGLSSAGTFTTHS